MPTLKYIYFNVKGRGETPRLLLAASGMDFEDKRIESADWPAIKPTTPFGSLPVLEVDGKPIGQSMAIARYVAHEGGLVGKNSFEQACIDAIVDTITDFRESLVKVKFMPEEEKEAAWTNFTEKTIPAVLAALEKIAENNQEKPGVFVGGKMTIADVHFFSILELVQGKLPDVLGAYPHLKKIFDGVATEGKIAEYIKKRPQTPF